MSNSIIFESLYAELEQSLLTSNAAQRLEWSRQIVDNKIDVKLLAQLLHSEKKVAMRFLWLLAELAETDASTLFESLPHLFEQRNKLDHIDIKPAFARYWLVCGVPEENEGEAINLLFHLIQSSDYSMTVKGTAMNALFNLTAKFPELKNELKISLQEELDKHTPNFRKRIEKLLGQLEQNQL